MIVNLINALNEINHTTLLLDTIVKTKNSLHFNQSEITMHSLLRRTSYNKKSWFTSSLTFILIVAMLIFVKIFKMMRNSEIKKIQLKIFLYNVPIVEIHIQTYNLFLFVLHQRMFIV